ncbi:MULTISPECIES: KilA-N domain-containing protein [Methylobacter]
MTTENPIVIANIAIRQDEEGRYFLNDLHKAAGGLQKHRPNYFLGNQQTQDLIYELALGGIPASDKIKHLEPVNTVRSFFVDQGTYVVKELVYAYAMWISPAFQVQVIRAYDALVTGQHSAVPANIETRLDRMEGFMEQMAGNLCLMSEVSVQQAQKLEVTARYIGLLEINQKGKIKVTRTIEAQVLALRAQGMSMGDIAHILRISKATVSQLVNGKYPMPESQAALPRESVEEALETMVEAERSVLLSRLAQLEGGQ